MSDKVIEAEQVNGQLDDSEMDQVTGGAATLHNVMMWAKFTTKAAINGVLGVFVSDTNPPDEGTGSNGTRA